MSLYGNMKDFLTLCGISVSWRTFLRFINCQGCMLQLLIHWFPNEILKFSWTVPFSMGVRVHTSRLRSSFKNAANGTAQKLRWRRVLYLLFLPPLTSTTVPQSPQRSIPISLILKFVVFIFPLYTILHPLILRISRQKKSSPYIYQSFDMLICP